MSKMIELPEDVYRKLELTAREQGLTPADWIATALPVHLRRSDRPPLSEWLDGLIGTVDSSHSSSNDQPRTPFGEIIARKLEKQGLRRQ
jgi:hypothetical protein